uniref:FBD domain-containing protein n=1 Tax=Solanum lycopersicum TaxID=4081 RepID=A0A3Q7G959_SOLLC
MFSDDDLISIRKFESFKVENRLFKVHKKSFEELEKSFKIKIFQRRSMSRCKVASGSKILENVPIQDTARTSLLSKPWVEIWFTLPNLVFDRHFFQYASNEQASPANHQLHTQQNIIKSINTVGKYMLPNRLFTCGMLTYLKLSRCIFNLPGGSRFPNIICLHLERSKFFRRQGSEDMRLNLPMLETLKCRYCTGVDCINMVSPEIENLFLHISYTVTLSCFNVNPIFTRIKHLCLNGKSLEVTKLPFCFCKLGSFRVPENLRFLSCAFCLLRNSPNLYELDIDEVVKVRHIVIINIGRLTCCYLSLFFLQKAELLSYLSMEQDCMNEALRMVRIVRLRKFKASSTEIYLRSVIISHPPIERSKK